MTKQRVPDRWDKVVAKWRARPVDDDWEFQFSDHDVAALLRREHQAVARLIARHRLLGHAGEWHNGFNEAIADILAALAKRAR